jgi:hypothetical protein
LLRSFCHELPNELLDHAKRQLIFVSFFQQST